MSKLVQLKQKIKSIKTTEKITHAIRLVSMSLYAKLEHQSGAVKNYTQSLQDLFNELLPYDPKWKGSLLFSSQLDNKPLFVIVTTSKGLCGGLNSNLFRFVLKNIEIHEDQSPRFVTIGQKAPRFIKDNDLGEAVLSYNDFNSNNYLSIASDFITKVTNNEVACTSITIFYNDPKSFFVQKPSMIKILPLKIDSNKAAEKKDEKFDKKIKTELIWEQNSQKILDYLSIRYVKSQVTYLLYQALIAEYAARFLAMDNSTNNAEKLIERLNLQYNKMRQGAITRDVAELCSGFMTNN